MNMPRKGWKSISIPTSLYDDVKKYVEESGYVSIADFTRYVLRKQLEGLGVEPKEV